MSNTKVQELHIPKNCKLPFATERKKKNNFFHVKSSQHGAKEIE